MQEQHDIIELIVKSIDAGNPDILEILFSHRDWFPRLLDENEKPRMSIIDGIEELSDEEKQIINDSSNKWIQHVQSAYNKSRLDDPKNMLEKGSKSETKISTQKQLLFPTYELIKGITANLLYHCVNRYAGQSDRFNYELIRKLSRRECRIIEPWMQASFCKPCDHYELHYFSSTKKSIACHKCGGELPVIRIFRLDIGFEKHKFKHKDLPIFISKYILKRKPDADVVLSQKMKDSNNKDLGDIDIYIPSTKTGIECKIFFNREPQGEQFENYENSVLNSLKNYSNMSNIERLIVITNLSEYNAKQLENELPSKLKEMGFNPRSIKVGYFSVVNLLNILNMEISMLTKN